MRTSRLTLVTWATRWEAKMYLVPTTISTMLPTSEYMVRFTAFQGG